MPTAFCMLTLTNYNSMTIAVILLLVVVALQVYATIENFKWSARLSEKELDLEKQEVSLDEREARNKEDFITLAETEAEMVEIHSTYVVTDADTMRYNSDKAIYNVARNRIAHNIAYDIIHKFNPEFDGEVMTYKFKIKEAE